MEINAANHYVTELKKGEFVALALHVCEFKWIKMFSIDLAKFMEMDTLENLINIALAEIN